MPILSIAPQNPTLGQGLAFSLMGFAIVFVMLFCLFIVIKLMVAIMESFSKKKAPAAEAPKAPVAAAAAATDKIPAAGSLGDIAIHDVEEKDAALIMAIVADKLGAPLNELRFKSIKKID